MRSDLIKKVEEAKGFRFDVMAPIVLLYKIGRITKKDFETILDMFFNFVEEFRVVSDDVLQVLKEEQNQKGGAHEKFRQKG